jgi:hypothetical protein
MASHIPVGLMMPPRRLSTSNGCQDHTTSTSATMPFVLRADHRSRGFQARPATSTARATSLRPPHPAPTVRDDRDTPLANWDGMRKGNHKFLKNRSRIFFMRGLDRNSRDGGDLPVGQMLWASEEREQYPDEDEAIADRRRPCSRCPRTRRLLVPASMQVNHPHERRNHE